MSDQKPSICPVCKKQSYIDRLKKTGVSMGWFCYKCNYVSLTK